MPRLVGPLNENLRLVEDAFEGTSIHTRGNEFTIDGDDAVVAARLVDELRLLLEQGQAVDPQVCTGPLIWSGPTSGPPRSSPPSFFVRPGGGRCAPRPAGRNATPTP